MHYLFWLIIFICMFGMLYIVSKNMVDVLFFIVLFVIMRVLLNEVDL